MDKKDLAKLAMIGLASGMMVSCQPQNSNQQKNQDGTQKAPMEKVEMGTQVKNFSSKLDNKAKRLFDKMNKDEQTKAMKRAAESCKGVNGCKGLGGCKTADHTCKGYNSCKGQGGCSVTPSEAVELMSQQMGQKRSNM